MKFLAGQLAYLLGDRELRGNVRALLKYLLFLSILITIYAVLFHLIKGNIEGESHSWVTGFYWTLVVMSTLGFGDITFTSDAGRVFSIVVLLSGVVFLLVLLPFLFIRLFYAPWLEARMRLRAPREVPANTEGHVILVEYDPIAAGLVERLRLEGIPYFVVEPDPAKAARFVSDDIATVMGDNDARQTYERLRVPSARLVVANCEDTVNTNVTLTVREVAPQVPIAAVIEEDDSADVLSLSGATWVLPLKRQLGESLATRVDAGTNRAHVIGRFKDLEIAELPARDTQYVGTSVRETRLRERHGVSVVGLWQRGRLQPAFPDSVIGKESVLVLVGTADQIGGLDGRLNERPARSTLTIVIGSGKVGSAAAAAVKRAGLTVHVVDRDAAALEPLRGRVDAIFAGDAADRAELERAGLHQAGTVLLTTNDDAMNIYLAVFCRRLNPGIRIVSRITHQRNLEAIHRAGADFVLSYTSLGVDAVMSLIEGYEPVVLGEGVRLFSIPVPASLAGHRLGDSAIGSRTGLSVVALERDDRVVGPLSVETVLSPDAELVMLGSQAQRHAFAVAFEGAKAVKAESASRS